MAAGTRRKATVAERVSAAAGTGAGADIQEAANIPAVTRAANITIESCCSCRAVGLPFLAQDARNGALSFLVVLRKSKSF
jgi:hypothetical protein